MTKKLTPLQSIRKHCQVFCLNEFTAISNCKNHECILKSKGYAPKKIAKFCAECAADGKVKECTGIILNTEETRDFGKCPLHVYKFGRNPFKSVNKGVTPDHLRKFKFEPKKASL